MRPDEEEGTDARISRWGLSSSDKLWIFVFLRGYCNLLVYVAFPFLLPFFPLGCRSYLSLMLRVIFVSIIFIWTGVQLKI